MMKLFSAFRWMLDRWYSGDRIRVSPTVGIFARLNALDEILIHGELATVTDRNVTIVENTTMIGYRLRYRATPTREGIRLLVELEGTSLKFVSATLDIEGEMVELFEEDLLIVSRDSSIDNG